MYHLHTLRHTFDLKSLNTKRPRQMTLELQVRGWDMDSSVAGLNQLMRSDPSPFDNTLSPTAIHNWLHWNVYRINVMFTYVK